jgi:site-specific DNA-methyltransferase (adenine-specific)
MKKMDDNSVDTIITDPPYGISFMGKKWDYDVPSIEIWRECLRVLKPGGTALIFAGSRTQHRMAVNVEDAGFIIKDTIMWFYGSGFPKATDISKQLIKRCEKKSTEKNEDVLTEQAKLWEGWKSHGLKPAYEPIIVAMKPNDGTYANNALEWEVSGLYIDGCRISTDDLLNGGAYIGKHSCSKRSSLHGDNRSAKGAGMFAEGKSTNKEYEQPLGRYPANIIFDEEVGEILDEQNGIDVNGVSRFFYCAKVSKKERGEGNIHPTVKPLKLMEYLCTMTKTPTGGKVLDPFMGSGTTGIACKNTGRDFIGIELDKTYYDIANKRIHDKITVFD